MRDGPEHAVHGGNQLVEEVILEASGADARYLCGKLRRAEVDEEPGYAVIIAADAGEDQDQLTNFALAEQVTVDVYNGAAVSRAILPAVHPFVLVASKEVNNRVTLLHIGGAVVAWGQGDVERLGHAERRAIEDHAPRTSIYRPVIA